MSTPAVQFLFRCPTCLGKGFSGVKGTPDFRTCAHCAGTRWIRKDPEKISGEEATAIREALASTPPDGDAEYERESVLTNVRKLLTRFYPQTVEIRADAPDEILLTNARGAAVRIFPEFRGGKFHHLNAAALPPDSE